MEKNLVIANWKQNKTEEEVTYWVNFLRDSLDKKPCNAEIVVCPQSIHISCLYDLIKSARINLILGAQDVSPFDDGSYTGEVSAKSLAEYVSYVLVGHSERRRFFGETSRDAARKTTILKSYHLTPVLCFSSLDEIKEWREEDPTLDPKKIVFAYEPLFAVGSGQADTPDDVVAVAKEVRHYLNSDVSVLYGGSANAKNVRSFIDTGQIQGFLVGQASLDPVDFTDILLSISA